MRVAEVRKFCKLDEAGDTLVRAAMSQLNLSARGYHRVLKLARTLRRSHRAGDCEFGGECANPVRTFGGGVAVPAEVDDIDLAQIQPIWCDENLRFNGAAFLKESCLQILLLSSNLIFS
jgi:hypothetical protein